MNNYEWMNNPTMEYIYGPLSKDYCIYFYFLSIIGFVLLIFALIGMVSVGISKNMGTSFYIEMLMVAIGYGIFYAYVNDCSWIWYFLFPK